MHGEEGFPDNKGRPRNGNPKFYDLLDDLARTHDKKSHDYASNDNPSGNYHFAGQMASMFSHSPQDAGFVGRIAEKIYRLANLEGSGKSPKNETIEDTERDIAVITILWMTDRRERRTPLNQSTDGGEVAGDLRSDAQVRADNDMDRIRKLQWGAKQAGAHEIHGFGPYPTDLTDRTPDKEVYQLLGNIAAMINNFLTHNR